MRAPMAEPLISVIVPVYKTEAYLPACLDSICGQTYRNLEIICVDDESPDRSGEILEEYAKKDSRIKVIHRKNGGLSAARNSGLAAATGDWVTGVDSDDYLTPDIYERAVEKLSEQVDVLIFGTQCFYEGVVEPAPGREAYLELPEECLMEQGNPGLTHLNVCFWNKLWRRAFVMEHGITFPEGLIHEDEYFYRCLAPRARGVYVLPHVGYMYRQRMGSIMFSKRTPIQRYREMMAIIEAIIQTYIKDGLQEKGREFLLGFWLALLDMTNEPGCPASFAQEARRINQKLIARHNLRCVYRNDFRLRKLSPNPWWQRLFLKVYSNRIAYRFIGVPLFSVVYENNRPVRKDSVWVNRFKRCLGR